MEVLIVSVVFLAIFGGAMLLVSHLAKRRFKAEWVQYGREWRDHGWPRFETPIKWIQRYFDEGYYGK